MTGTNLGLNGQPVKFLGAFVSNVTSNLGLSTGPSSINITLVEDPINNVFFEPPKLGEFATIHVGPTWKFSGIITKYERDISNISGRRIRVSMSDVRKAMAMAPSILAPGAEAIAARIENTECSVLDIYGAFRVEFEGLVLDLSGWNSSGMTYNKILTALNGGNVRFGEYLLPISRQTVKVFGEEYRFDLTEISNLVSDEQRVNTNLVPLSNIIEDLSTRHSFDWFIESERATDGIIDVTVKIIDRSFDSTTLDLQSFLDIHEDKVITATSGVELRTDVSCLALQGALVEQLERVNIEGLAVEPIDLTTESGSNNYVMTEDEMRFVLSGRNSWESWVVLPTEIGGGGGFSRYGGKLDDDHIQPIFDAATLYNSFNANRNIPKNDLRDKAFLVGLEYANSGKVYEKLKSKAEASYGKRWVHADILNDVIESAWTRGAVGGNDDPNEYFRQDDGRTRAYVEFSSEDLGLGLSIGGAQQLFGDIDLFRNVTRFGNTFSNVLGAQAAIVSVELSDQFDIEVATINTEKSNYVYDNSSDGISSFNEQNEITFSNAGVVRTKLFVAATVDKDGVITIDSPVAEKAPDPYELLTKLLLSSAILNRSAGRSDEKITRSLQRELRNELRRIGQQIRVKGIDFNLLDRKVAAQKELRRLDAKAKEIADAAEEEEKEDADGNKVRDAERINSTIVQYLGTASFKSHPRCFQPRFAYIPTRSRTLRYGPVFSSELDGMAQGKLEVIQDDGFAPWEFGSISAMAEAMQIKIDNATSLQKEVFSANISVEGYPMFNLGQALGQNGNINSINITFGGGVRTSYSLQTFTRKFGELTKEDLATIALFTTSSAKRVFSQDVTGFNQRHRFGVNKNFGRGGTSTGVGGATHLG